MTPSEASISPTVHEHLKKVKQASSLYFSLGLSVFGARKSAEKLPVKLW
jgi:hypothetical protein